MFLSDWTVLCLARVLQPIAHHASSLWIPCLSLRSLDCHELGYKLCRVCWERLYTLLLHFLYSGEVCNKTSEIAKRSICPEFPEYGPIRPLHESCHLYNVAYLFDNDLTVIFALFMSLWATVFMELWKRRQSVMVWEWDLEMDEQEEQTRPEFEVF